MAKKNRLPSKSITTPAGTAEWPHLHAPDTKFDEGGFGNYNTGLILSAQDAQPLIEAVEEIQAATMQAVKEDKGKKPKAAPYEPYTENEDGTYTFQFKMKAGGVRKDGSTWEMRPKLFDAKGGRIPEGTRIGGGSTMKVAADVGGYSAPFGVGVTLRLNAVQVIKLEQWGGKSADDFGFGEEDGFVASEDDDAGGYFDDADESEDDIEDADF